MIWHPKELPSSAVGARAFNSLGWENFAEHGFDGAAAGLLWCGPDDALGRRWRG